MEGQRVYEHIAIGEDGVARIGDTTMKVLELVAERVAWGWSPEELLLNHPYLTLGQIHAALAYYADHARELDAQLEEDRRFRAQMRAQDGGAPFRDRLRALSRR